MQASDPAFGASRGGFALHKGMEGAFTGRRVLLVEGVRCSGATMKAATKTIAQDGALAIDSLSLATIDRNLLAEASAQDEYGG